MIFLGHLKTDDDLEGHVKVQLCIKGQGLAPFPQPRPQLLELVKKHMERFITRVMLGPSFIYDSRSNNSQI
jgi:hypothetical protein